MRGPIISPRLIRSRMAMSMYWSAPRSRTVVTPASSVRIAPLRARNTSTAGGLLVSCFSIGSPGVSSVYMVMCVWTSISPGNPVYFERSMISAPAGMAEASVVTRANAVALDDHDRVGPQLSFGVPELSESHRLDRFCARLSPAQKSQRAHRRQENRARKIRVVFITPTPSARGQSSAASDFYFSWEWNAIGKNCGITAGGGSLSCACFALRTN